MGKYLADIGRRKSLLIGIIFVCISMFGFGILGWIPDTTTFIVLGFIFRFCGGVGSSALHVSSYAMIALEYPDSLT